MEEKPLNINLPIPVNKKDEDLLKIPPHSNNTKPVDKTQKASHLEMPLQMNNLRPTQSSHANIEETKDHRR